MVATMPHQGAARAVPHTVSDLLASYDVDMDHAQRVAALALELFDQTRPVHRLGTKARRLLELGALLHNVGLNIDQAAHHTVGRDIVLANPLADLSPNEQAAVACLVAFHRKKVRPEQEPTFLQLSPRQQQRVLRLAALLRVADGLDYSQTQSTQLAACALAEDRVLCRLRGPYAAEDGPRAQKKADLWHKVLAVPMVVEPDISSDALPAEPPALPPEAPPATNPWPLSSTHTSLADVGRCMLRQYFQTLLAHERGVYADDDPEDVHQMRVATRRLRALLQILAPVAPPQQVRFFRREIQRAARVLAPVRDADVLLLHLRAYAAEQPAAAQEGIQMVADTLARTRASSLARAVTLLNSNRFARTRQDFARFMTEQPRDWDTRIRVRDLAGRMLWQRYEELRWYETLIDTQADLRSQEERLHEMRIAGKRLRYMLETVADAWSEPQQRRVLKPLRQMQEHLGGLQDIAVAVTTMAALKVPAAARPALQAYCTSREAEREKLMDALPECIDRVLSETYSRDLARLIGQL